MSWKTKLAIAFSLSLALMVGLCLLVPWNRTSRSGERPQRQEVGAAPEVIPAPGPKVEPEAPVPEPEEKKVVAREAPPEEGPRYGPPDPNGWTVRGRIVRAPGGGDAAADETQEAAPVAGAVIRIANHPRQTRPEDAPPPMKKRTGADGLFEFEGVTGKVQMRLEIDAPGAAVRTLGFRFGAPRDVKEKDLGDVFVEPGGDLTVRLVGPRGEPARKGRVLVNKSRNSPGRSEKLQSLGLNESRRDAEERGEGEYFLERVALGPLTVEATAPGYAPVSGTPVELPRAEALVIEMAESPLVTGLVQDAEGKPISGAEVETNHANVPYRAKADETGRYTFDNLGEGGHTLNATAEGYVRASKGNIQAGAEDVDFTLEREALVKGRVVAGEGGKAIAGARAELRVAESRGSGAQFTADADAEGAFAIRKVTAGSYLLVIDHAEYAPFVEKEPRALAAGDTVDLGAVSLGPGLSAAGKVVDAASEEPIAEAQVTFTREAEAERGSGRREAKSGADGAFEVKGLSEGRYLVAATARGYLRGKSRTVTIGSGDERELKVALERGAALAGVVVDAAGKPIAGARLQPNITYDQFGNSDWQEMNENFSDLWNQSVQSDAEGRFRLEGLRPYDRYALMASHTDYAGRTITGLAVKARETLEDIRIELLRGGAVRGSVRDEKGKPVAGASVSAEREDVDSDAAGGQLWMGSGGNAVTSDKEGNFTLAHIPAGTHTVRASIRSKAPASRQGVRVEEADTVDGIELTLGAGERLSGRVVDEEDKPIAGADVHIYTREFTSIRTDDEGRFEAQGLEPGQLQINASKQGFDGQGQMVTVPASDVVIKLGRAARLRGVVRAPEGGSVPSNVQLSAIAVSVDGRGGGSRGQYLGDSTGNFEMTVAPGTWSLVAQARGYKPGRTESYSVKAGETVEGIEIQLERGLSIRGVVVAAGSGEPVAGARIAFQDRDEAAGRSVFGAPGATSGEDGKFTYDGLAEGSLTVVATHAQFAPRVMTGVSAAGGELRIELGQGGGIRGQVLRGGVPLPGVQVQAWRQDPSPTNMLAGGKGDRTDGEGRFEIAGLAAGEYQVSFYNPRGGMQQRNQRVTVFEGQFAELILGQESGVRLHGRVLAGGKPLGGGSIHATQKGRGEGSWGQIGAGGSYELELPGPGTYWLMLYIPSGQGQRSARVEATMPPGETDLALDIELPSGSITGVVTDLATGNGVAGAQVLAHAAGASFRSLNEAFQSMQSMTQTDAQGRFTLENLPAGVFTLWVFADGYVESRVKAPKLEAGGALAGLRVELEQGTQFQARVLDENGQPLQGAIALLRGAGGELVASARPAISDGEGQLNLRGLEPGAYRMTVTHASYARTSLSIDVGAGGAPPSVTLKPGGAILARVVDGSGSPVEGAEVQIVDAGGEDLALDASPFTGFGGNATGSDGVVSVRNLPTGEYRVAAVKDRARARPERVTVTVGGTAQVELRLTD